MLTVTAVQDNNMVKKYFSENGLTASADSGCMEAKSDGEVLGFSLYCLKKDEMTIYKIMPEGDFLLADGILRSTLHLADRRNISNVYYTVESEAICKKAGFIKNTEKRLLDVSLLSKDCCSKCNSK